MLKAERFNLQSVQDYNHFYPIMEEWWKNKGWIPYHPEVLSKTGLMIYESETPVCAAWIFKTDSTVGLVGHIITSKDVKPKQKKVCLEFLFQALEQESKELGIKMLVFFMTTNSLTKIAEKLGYLSSQQKCNELVKII